MNELTIADTTIHRDSNDRYCLNDLHRAAGGEEKHSPNRWARSAACKSLILLLTPKKALAPFEIVKGGAAPGAYGCKEVVYSYAMWVSTEFHLKVIEAYDALVTQPPTQMPNLNDPRVLQGLLLGYSQQLIVAEAKIAEQTPLVDAIKLISASPGDLCLSDAAKSLGMKIKDFIGWLRANDWIFRRLGSGQWAAKADKMKAGLLDHRQAMVNLGKENERSVSQCVVTPKGLTTIAIALGREISPLFAPH